MNQKLSLFACVIRYAAILNFFAFIMALLFLGGDALNSKQEAGRYFLGQHGKMTEVSAAVFAYSKWHAISSMLLIPVAMLFTLLSKPSSTEQKWQTKLVTASIAVSFLYAFFKYR